MLACIPHCKQLTVGTARKPWQRRLWYHQWNGIGAFAKLYLQQKESKGKLRIDLRSIYFGHGKEKKYLLHPVAMYMQSLPAAVCITTHCEVYLL